MRLSNGLSRLQPAGMMLPEMAFDTEPGDLTADAAQTLLNCALPDGNKFLFFLELFTSCRSGNSRSVTFDTPFVTG
jgi:hypothetical protein